MGAHRLLPRRWRSGAPLLVTCPVGGPVAAELIQVPPGEQPGVMAVIEHNFDGILPDRLNRPDADIFLPEHQDLLSGTVSFHLGGRRVHAQVLERQLKAAAVRKTHFQQPGFAAYFDFGRNWIRHRSASIRAACLIQDQTGSQGL
jgi:hypothetical protein